MCAGGLRGLKYGVTRNYVLGLEAVLPTGEVIRTGGRLWKDVAGYDLTRLLTGSEGTLAVITEVTVALLPMPAVARTGVAYFDSPVRRGPGGRGRHPRRAGPGDPGVPRQPLRQRRRGLRPPRPGPPGRRPAPLRRRRHAGGGRAVAGHHGCDLRTGRCARGHHGPRCRRVRGVAHRAALLAAGAGPARPDHAPRGRHRPAAEDRRDGRPDRGDQRPAPGRLRHLRSRRRRQPPPDDRLRPADGDARHRAEAAFGEIFAAAMDLGGTITGEHGVGAAKRGLPQARLGADQMALLRRLKAAFDPAGILNPGKLGS